MAGYRIGVSTHGRARSRPTREGPTDGLSKRPWASPADVPIRRPRLQPCRNRPRSACVSAEGSPGHSAWRAAVLLFGRRSAEKEIRQPRMQLAQVTLPPQQSTGMRPLCLSHPRGRPLRFVTSADDPLAMELRTLFDAVAPLVADRSA